MQNDKFILISNSNKSGNVSIKLPWGKNSKSFDINNVEMQGTVLAPLKCAASIDMIGKEALKENHSILYKYKKCVTIPPLSMIDDILAVTNCSVNSLKMNSIVEAKLRTKNLQLGSNKCFHMHVGKRDRECKNLTVNNSTMNTTTKEKYLGNILSANGKIDENIAERYNRGIGLVNHIISMLKEVHFGRYYFEMALLFRNSILINGMLFSIEALYGLKSKHLEMLEGCDKYFFRKIFNAHSKTAIEAFYIETGTLPLRFAIIARRLMFFWNILNKSDSELAKQVYEAQRVAPLPNDWVSQIEDDLQFCNIHLSETEIKMMKRTKFKALVSDRISEEGHKYLENLKASHSKSKGLSVQMKMQSYLRNQDISLQEKQLLFKFRTFTYECTENFKHMHENDTKCNVCDTDDTQEHLINCRIVADIVSSDLKHADIFGSIQKQKNIIKHLITVDNRRKLEL